MSCGAARFVDDVVVDVVVVAIVIQSLRAFRRAS